MKNIKYATIAEKELIENAWLDIDIPDSYIINPIKDIPEAFKSEPEVFFIYMMSRPEYIGAFCKYIMNITLYPHQCLVLRELWTHRFPMLIAARGFSKCVRDALIITNNGTCKIEDLIPEDFPAMEKYYLDDCYIYGENGFNKAEYVWKNTPSKTIKIATYMGYELEGTENHPIRVVREGKLEWVNMEDLKIDDIVPIDRTECWPENTNDIPEDIGYWMGALVGDGGYTQRGHISFTNQDQNVVEQVSDIFLKLYGKPLKKLNYPDKDYQYLICGVKIWDDLFQKYGFNSPVCGEKDIPSSIWSASKKTAAAFLRGLFDTDGCVTKPGTVVELSCKSPNMAKSVQQLLLRFGIQSKKVKQLNKKYNKYYYKVQMSSNNLLKFREHIGFTIQYKKDRLDLGCNKTKNPNFDLIPRSMCMDLILSLSKKFKDDKITKSLLFRKYSNPHRLRTYEISYNTLSKILDNSNIYSDTDEWKNLQQINDKNYFYDTIKSIDHGFNDTYDVYIPNDHSFLSNGFISHNSYLLGLYGLLRIVFMPGRKVIACGAGFRQSKIIFEYAEKFWKNAPILRDMINDPHAEPIHGNDMWRFNINDGHLIALPVGTGEKIRGQRAHDLLIDEMKSINVQIFEEVLGPFASVPSDPVHIAQRKASQEKSNKN